MSDNTAYTDISNTKTKEMTTSKKNLLLQIEDRRQILNNHNLESLTVKQSNQKVNSIK